MSKDHFPFNNDVSHLIWESKYRYQTNNIGGDKEQSIEQSWQRIASCLAQVEQNQMRFWQEQFYSILENFRSFTSCFWTGSTPLAGKESAFSEFNQQGRHCKTWRQGMYLPY
jgi:hypothetical protein